jgi:hydrogenase maturation protein HypF
LREAHASRRDDGIWDDAGRMLVRKRLRIGGVVQGVGFRPFVHALATRLKFAGHVFNSTSGVVIEAEGSTIAIDELERALRSQLPPLARIDSFESVDIEVRGDTGFTILPSVDDANAVALVPPDVAACDACLAEVAEPANRRFGYAFTNCTHCGPRYTVIRALPYDRARTTMAAFTMCAACQAEYDDPGDRRFHAQPNACADCGPRLSRDIGDVRDAIRRGEIVAMRGLGGFQLVCEAANEDAVNRLRVRKRRSEKPFAVMVPNLDVAERLCIIGDDERLALLSRERPVVILQRRDGPSPLAPGNDTLGVMLPYTPLHATLIEGFEALVMTSGNVSEEPIVIDNDAAIDQLAPIADSFLLHDRDIHTRVDDSVVRVFEGKVRPLRRARSFAPRPIDLGESIPELLACGGQLKNTLCLTKGSLAFVSQHIGDLENYETLQFFEETLQRMQALFRIDPVAVAHDLHPTYTTTRFAQTLGLRTIGVQHHHAHIASCMAEHGLRERIIGVAMDGTGYGTDGAIWGGEFLIADRASFRRRAHLRYIPLPGGDSAIRQPWRVALSHLIDAGRADTSLPVDEAKRKAVASMIERGIHTVPTSSCGRLFDAVASLAGLRQEVTFEAQAAIELESIARGIAADRAYPYAITNDQPMQIDLRATIAAIVDDRERGQSAAQIAARFHETMADVIESTCVRIRDDEALNRVCLSGGTFQNMLLLGNTTTRLRQRGFEVFIHECVPPNDGGLSLGQAAVAGEMLARGL